MPANVVKTAEDERLWNKAKRLAAKQGHEKDYPYIMGIFQRMKKGLQKSFIVPPEYRNNSYPGQVPTPDRILQKLDLDKRPPGITMDRLLGESTGPMLRVASVVKGLGFDLTQEIDLEKFLEGTFQGATNELTMRQSVIAKARDMGCDPAVRSVLLQRSLEYWRSNKLNKSKGGPYIGPRGGKWEDPEHTRPWKEEKAKTRYVYGLKFRPAGFATVPKGYKIVAHPKFKHGAVEYDRPLTADEIKSFELTPILNQGQLQDRVSKIVAEMKEYAEEYLEEAEDDPRYFAQAVRQKFESLGAGYIEDMNPLINQVLNQLQEAQGGIEKKFEVDVHPKLGSIGKETYHVVSETEDTVKVSTRPDSSFGPTMPKASLKHFKNDLAGKVVLPKSGRGDIDAVVTGKAEFVGKGDDGLVFKVGDKAVKVSTTVPFQPMNPGHRSPQQAIEMLRGQHAIAQEMILAGVSGIQNSEFVVHGDKGFQVKDWVEIPEKFTRAQLDEAQDIIHQMHEKGYALNDQVQIGLDKAGKVVLFDVGKTEKMSEKDKQRDDIYSPIRADLGNLAFLYKQHGEMFVNKKAPRGKEEWKRLKAKLPRWIAKKDPKKLDFAEDRIIRVADILADEAHATLEGKQLKMRRDQIWKEQDEFLALVDAAREGLEKAERLRFILVKSEGGPYIGPRGGKWADPEHTIPWKEKKGRKRKYLFHTTGYHLMEQIMEDGLQPRRGAGTFQGGGYAAHSQGKVFLAAHFDAANDWADKVQQQLEDQSDETHEQIPVMLRVVHRKTKVDTVGEKDVEGSRFVEKQIPPEDIEFYHPKKGWVPIALWGRDTGTEHAIAEKDEHGEYVHSAGEGGYTPTNEKDAGAKSKVREALLAEQAKREALMKEVEAKAKEAKKQEPKVLAAEQAKWTGEKRRKKIAELLAQKRPSPIPGYTMNGLMTSVEVDGRRFVWREILQVDMQGNDLEKALYIGPRGGKWGDPQHTIPYDPKKHGERTVAEAHLHQAEAAFLRAKKAIARGNQGKAKEALQAMLRHAQQAKKSGLSEKRYREAIKAKETLEAKLSQPRKKKKQIFVIDKTTTVEKQQKKEPGKKKQIFVLDKTGEENKQIQIPAEVLGEEKPTGGTSEAQKIQPKSSAALQMGNRALKLAKQDLKAATQQMNEYMKAPTERAFQITKEELTRAYKTADKARYHFDQAEDASQADKARKIIGELLAALQTLEAVHGKLKPKKESDPGWERMPEAEANLTQSKTLQEQAKALEKDDLKQALQLYQEATDAAREALGVYHKAGDNEKAKEAEAQWQAVQDRVNDLRGFVKPVDEKDSIVEDPQSTNPQRAKAFAEKLIELLKKHGFKVANLWVKPGVATRVYLPGKQFVDIGADGSIQGTRANPGNRGVTFDELNLYPNLRKNWAKALNEFRQWHQDRLDVRNKKEDRLDAIRADQQESALPEGFEGFEGTTKEEKNKDPLGAARELQSKLVSLQRGASIVVKGVKGTWTLKNTSVVSGSPFFVKEGTKGRKGYVVNIVRADKTVEIRESKTGESTGKVVFTGQITKVQEKPKMVIQEPKKKKERVLAVEQGEHVWGSRADKAVRNSADLEKLSPDEQAKHVTKKNLFVQLSVDEQLEKGHTPQSIVMRRAVESCIAAKAPNSLEGRQQYMEGIDFLARTLESCRTDQDIQDFMIDWMHLAQGERKQGEYSESDLERIRQEYLKANSIQSTMNANEFQLLKKQVADNQTTLHLMRIAKVRTGSDEYQDLYQETQELQEHLNELKKSEFPGNYTLMRFHLNVPKRGQLGFEHHHKEGKLVVFLPDPSLKTGVDNKYHNLAEALGPKMKKLVLTGGLYKVFAGRRGEIKPPKAFDDARKTIKQMNKNPEQVDALLREATGSKKSTKQKRKPYRWERDVPGEIDRKGGQPVDKADPEALASMFNFKNVQFGNWVTEEDADTHLRGAFGALLDLSEILGVSPDKVSLNGRLSLGVGARGAGAARAHYEPDKRIINITKIAGGGSLAHEWAHAFDNILSRAFNPTSTQAGVFMSGGDIQGVPQAVQDAMRDVFDTMRFGADNAGFAKLDREARALMAVRDRQLTWEERSVITDWKRKRKRISRQKTNFLVDAEGIGGKYWSRPHEMFARCFESFIEDTLEDNGRRSSYLVSGTRKFYQGTRVVRDPVTGEERPAQPYPQGEERKAINAAMAKLMQVLKDTKSFEKAMRFLMDLGKKSEKHQLEKAIEPQDFRKAQPRGGKYHRRIPSADGKKFRYIYKPEDYEKREDKHLSGEEANKAYVSKRIEKCIAQYGQKGCEPKGLEALVKKYGHKMIGKCLQESVTKGACKFKKGRFYLSGKGE